MFSLTKPDKEAIGRFLAEQSAAEFTYPETGATRGTLPAGYTVDHNRVRLGYTEEAFQNAAASIRRWDQFRLGWIEPFPAADPVAPGVTLVLRVRHLGFWSLISNRILYTVDEPTRFGYAYGTLTGHAEQGEERFLVERTPGGEVFYDILAFSRPRHWAARLAKIYTRALQRRFVVESLAAVATAASRPAGTYC